MKPSSNFFQVERVKNKLADDNTLPVKDFQPSLDKFNELHDIVSIFTFIQCLFLVTPFLNLITIFVKRVTNVKCHSLSLTHDYLKDYQK